MATFRAGVRLLCLDAGCDFVHDLVEQIDRNSEVVDEGLPVGNGQLALQKHVWTKNDSTWKVVEFKFI